MTPSEPDLPAAASGQVGKRGLAAGTAGKPAQRLEDLLGGVQDAARAMLEAEESLGLLRERFDHSQDQAAQGELAAQALDQVERQLELTRQRRQQLDSIEGRLWDRRNRIERFLIDARGRAWWRARRDRARAATIASDGNSDVSV